MNGQKFLSILAGLNKDDIPKETVDDFAKFVDNIVNQEKRQAEDEEKRKQAVPEEVPDFQDVQVGTVVVRSQHYLKEKCQKDKGQIGIIVKMEIYQDDLCGVIHWPTIHWEGEHHSSTSHPMNVACKDGRTLPTKTMNANQLIR